MAARGVYSATLAAAVTAGVSASVTGTGGCSPPAPPSSFLFDAGLPQGGAGGAAGGAPTDAGPDADDTLGGPCTVGAQCDDGIDCTFDVCDLALARCRFTPDDTKCNNGIYCDGLERCVNKLGCQPGEPVTCSDGNPCDIDRCDEATHECVSEPRDVDQDGDPDDHCGGGDCDDLEPTVSSLAPEVCANGRDDDCDGELDEPDCATASHDTCFDLLVLPAPGYHQMTTTAAVLDYAASCSVENGTLARDVVAGVMLAAGPPVDVQLTARTEQADVALALMGQCGLAASEIACSPGWAHPNGGRVAKLRGRSVGSPTQQTPLAAYVTTELGSQVTVGYELLPATSQPLNETCGTALPLGPSTPTVASLVGAAVDVPSVCGTHTGDLVYQLVVAAPSDLALYATSVDGDGLPLLSLRAAGCAELADEIGCNFAPSATASAHVFRHALAPGSYFVMVAASAPTDVLLTAELSAPTAAPADEDCAGAPALAPNTTIDVPLAWHQDDVPTSCLPGGTDAVYALELGQASDVLLLGRFSLSDQAAVALFAPACGPSDDLACGTAVLSPARAQYRNLPAGSYRVVAESLHAQPMQLTALVRKAVPPTLVPLSDACGDALAVPAGGGFFQGTTANAQADFAGGCDLGNQPGGGAPDQLLTLTLAEPRRVVLDMQGSAYQTLLAVRAGATCPGSQLSKACAAGYYPERSFLDLSLGSGSHYVQVDGYAGSFGPWFLDVFVVAP